MMRFRSLLIGFVLMMACQTISQVIDFSQDEPAAVQNGGLYALRHNRSAFKTQISQTGSLPLAPAEEHVPATKFQVRYHPDGQIYVGDIVSFEVLAPEDAKLEDAQVEIFLVKDEEEISLASGGFSGFGIGSRYQATMRWVWDTSDLATGEYQLKYKIDAIGENWTETVVLLPVLDLPAEEQNAMWELKSIECCEIYYIKESEVDRDIDRISAAIETQADIAAGKLGVGFAEKVPVVLMPRLLGHGGFAGKEIYISYLDRNYAGNALDQVVHHELIHILDRRVGGEYVPSFFVEGFAVYQSQGHYKKEPLLARLKAVQHLGWYLPLDSLVDDFYFSQHELSYIEAGAVIAFMVDRWGWPAFDQFYRNISPPKEQRDAYQVINDALIAHYGVTFQQLEMLLLAELEVFPVYPDMVEDVSLTVKLFNTLRRYQEILDPSAYFLTAWLPDLQTMRSRGIVADLMRRPSNPENLALETMLVYASHKMQEGSFSQAEEALDAASMVLNAYSQKKTLPFSVHWMAEDYLQIVWELSELQLVPQYIELNGNQAYVQVNARITPPQYLTMTQGSDGWRLDH